MYRINPLNRYTLITPDEVIAKAAIDENADVRILQASIEVAEERWIAPALGNKFYEELLDMKNRTVTNVNKADILAAVNNGRQAEGKELVADLPIGTIINAIEFIGDNDYIKLWNRFLWKITAEAVDLASTVPNWLRNTAQGLQLNNPNVIGGNSASSASGSRRDIDFKTDKLIQDRINPLIERMHQWICDRYTLYPNYSIPCKCEEDGINAEGKGGWIFGVYEDDEATSSPVTTAAAPVKSGGTLQRIQFITEPNQTKYPSDEDPNRLSILDTLQGAQFESFSLEGIELTVGNNPGEMKPFNSAVGYIEWNEASEASLRAILKIRK